MIYLYPQQNRRIFIPALIAFLVLISQPSFSQLVFKNPETIQGDGTSVGSVFRFSQVTSGIDALVSIDSLVNNASLHDIDEKGVGYEDAFQPRIKSGGRGVSYILFTIKFVLRNSFVPAALNSVTATNLDLDGNNMLKERCEFDMNGGIVAYVSNTPEISVTLNNGHFLGQNISGNEYTEIDTSAQVVMFKVTGTNITEFKVRLGASLTNNSSAARQYSVYMKDFAMQNATTLPVTLTDFRAALKDNYAVLNWTTTTHTNFSHFVVEKGTTGKDFAEAGIVFADSSNSSILSDYSFKDDLKNSASNNHFYRLKMVDIDSRYSYSETKMIRTVTESSIKISAFPNPVTNELRVQIPTEWQDKQVVYEIYNNSGLLVQQINQSRAAQVQPINVSRLTGGTYIVKVRKGAETATSKIIKAN